MKTHRGKEETAAWKQKSVWVSEEDKIVSEIDRRISDIKCSAQNSQKINTFVSPTII